MSKFVVVNQAPEVVAKNEYIIGKPNFFKEIEQHRHKQPRSGLTGSFHMRMILDSIAQNYDPQNMTAYSAKVHSYEGRPFSSDEELNDILVEMLQRDYPAIFVKYVDTKLRQRPVGTQTVYYVDSNIPGALELFHQQGLAQIEQ